MSITLNEVQNLTGRGAVFDRSGNKVGSLGQVYLDNETQEPRWVTVKTGLFGTKESFVPLEGARLDGDDVVVAYEESLIKDAPRIDEDGQISPHEEERLYAHYGLTDPATTARSSHDDVNDDRAGRSGYDTSGPTTDEAMTRSEEQLRVGTATEEAGRARLRKYVVTEDVTTTVPVSHEEVRVETEPITEANRAAAESGPAISEEEHEVVLHAERPVVEKEAVPVERVKMTTDTVTEQQTVSDEVRKEQVELDDAGRRRPNPGTESDPSRG